MSAGIFEAMALVMQDIEAIGKDQENKQQGFKYRGIDDIYNSLHGILAKRCVFTTPEVLEKHREERTNKNGTTLAFTTLRIRYTFWHKDGSNVSCVVEGEGMDSGDKSSNKAMAVAHKYALLQTFCIPTADEKDPDATTHEVTPKRSQVFDDLCASIDNAADIAELERAGKEVAAARITDWEKAELRARYGKRSAEIKKK